RSETSEIGRFKPGFAAILRRGNRPLFPVGVAGAFQAMKRKSWFVKPTRVRVVFGKPLSFAEIEAFCASNEDDALIDLVRSRVVACYEAAEHWRVTGTPPASIP